MVSQGYFLGDIPPLTSLRPLTETATTPDRTWTRKNYFLPNQLNNPAPLPVSGDPLYQNPPERLKLPELVPGLNFDGMNDVSGVTPPDPTGDVGKDHFVQMVNNNGGSRFQIWNKQGQAVFGPALTSTIWSQVNAGSIGDPIIQYDHAAQRWLMMEMKDFGNNTLLLAISNTSDPTKGWKAFAFSTLGFPDYPKLYVWDNCYFVTVNEIVNGNKCSGFALEKQALLNGNPNFKIYRFEMPNYLGIQYQPATGVDWEMGPPPPPGSPAYILRLYDDAWDGGTDHLQLWSLQIDWQNEALSNLTGPQLITPAPFETKVCFSGLFDCIEQPGPTAPRITALENIIMYRAPYQNFGTHESIVLNHIADVSGQVGVGGDAQVRWYELRRPTGGNWQLYQQGTYGPDAPTNRFMGTIAMDERGNIGLGYSVCSSTGTYPGLRLSGRRSGDPLGQMTVAEYTLQAGTKDHGDPRWGDYSSLAVDPEDGRTFWFTGEYQGNAGGWSTRIGSFQISRDSLDITPITLTKPLPSPALGMAETVTVNIFNSGLLPTTQTAVSLLVEGVPIVTDSLADTILPGATYPHTFSVPVDLSAVGKNYQIMAITRWAADQFDRNDTLRTTIRHLTSNDAQAGGRANFPGIVCGNNYDLEFILRNAGADTLKSARIHWKINNTAYQDKGWTGSLPPGAQDTVTLPLTGIGEGSNFFYAHTELPNGQADEEVRNDSMFFKFSGNVDGNYLEASAQTNFGILRIELRKQNNVLLATREFPAQGAATLPLCVDNGTCYKLVIKSSTLAWDGHFQLLDIFGNVLLTASTAEPEERVFSFCTPTLKSNDVGPYRLRHPVSSPDLGGNEPVRIDIRNFGTSEQSNFPVSYRIDNQPPVELLIPGSIKPGEIATLDFPGTVSFDTADKVVHFEIKTSLLADESPANDTRMAEVVKRPQRDVGILGLQAVDLCADTLKGSFQYRVRNNGLAPVRVATYTVKLNGIIFQTFDDSLRLESGEDRSGTVELQGLKTGTNQVEMFVYGVNGIALDNIPGNDAAGLEFEISPGGYGVRLALVTDSKPQETRFEIVDEQGQVVFSGQPAPHPTQLDLRYACLQPGACYVFRLYDAGGDGMDGYVQLQSDDGLLAVFFGGNFGEVLELPFCNTAPCVGFSLTATTLPPSGLSQPDGSITVQPIGGVAPFSYSLNGGTPQQSPVFSGLSAGTYLLTCVDTNHCQTSLTVNLNLSGVSPAMPARRLEIGPNPTDALLWLSLPASGSEMRAYGHLFDNRGKQLEILQLTRWDDTLRGVASLEKLPVGVYWVVIQVSGNYFCARVLKK
jgi:hypothetical protein